MLQQGSVRKRSTVLCILRPQPLGPEHDWPGSMILLLAHNTTCGRFYFSYTSVVHIFITRTRYYLFYNAHFLNLGVAAAVYIGCGRPAFPPFPVS